MYYSIHSLVAFFQKYKKVKDGEIKKPVYEFNASAPPTISNISLVIAVCLALLYVSFNWSLNSEALSVALCIAVILAPCSPAIESEIALKS